MECAEEAPLVDECWNAACRKPHTWNSTCCQVRVTSIPAGAAADDAPDPAAAGRGFTVTSACLATTDAMDCLALSTDWASLRETATGNPNTSRTYRPTTGSTTGS